MSEENVFGLFPQKRIKPFDGMEITSDVWEQAHAYHRQTQQAHNLIFHGSGIVAGLEIIASDPANQMIFILPGVAVDSFGRPIVLSEPIAYDLGNEVEGPLYLSLTHRESEQKVTSSISAEAPRYIQDEFLITARPSLPESESIELARFNRENREAALMDARDPFHPQINEIDLRYRRDISSSPDRLLTAAVVYLGKVKQKNHGRGLTCLSQECKTSLHINLVVDDEVKFTPNVLEYSLIYLVAEGTFKLSDTQVKALKGYLDNNGFLFLESCDEPAKAAMVNLCVDLGMNLEPVTRESPLLSIPYRFAAPCLGFEKEGTLLAGKGMVLSTFNYGRLWFGETHQEIPSRESIRSCMEWGTNLLAQILNSQID